VELDTIVCADALTFLKGIPDDAIDMALTSPPYDNLRTYKGYSWDFEGIARQQPPAKAGSLSFQISSSRRTAAWSHDGRH